MLEIKEIYKEYELGKQGTETYQKVSALNGVSVNFRKSEFVAILGQSGCGKTTLLNIIGGLDRYTSGDLVIDGKSTKDYTDKDWDTYRNKKIGFVFQSYNLIPHLNVFENVELALTLSGIKKADRKQKVIDALSQVGLADKIYARPNQLSGGQMQRVAIARALINDPEIILADEPTGALDSKTSVQVMEILKEISKDKLIIMVTHNPELAETYASRTIRLLDGNIIEDTKPYELEKEEEQVEEGKSKKRMSFFTALSLSFKNLLTKKARTLLVSIAGSIGIIGIALILALSSGFQAYVNNVQKDSLSSYPLTIEAVSMDFASMFGMLMNDSAQNTPSEEGVVNKNDVIVDMFKGFTSGSKQNNLEDFKVWLDSNEEIAELTTAIQYSYHFNFNIYDKQDNAQLSPTSLIYDGTIAWLDAKFGTNVFPQFEAQYKTANGLGENYVLTDVEIKAIKSTDAYGSALLNYFNFNILGGSGMAMVASVQAMKDSYLTNFVEMIDNNKLLKSQYDVVATADGVAKNNLFESLGAKDIVIVLDEKGNLSDYALYTLGIKKSPTIDEIAGNLAGNPDYEIPADDGYTYDEIVGREYKVLLDTDYYKEIGGQMVDIRSALKNNAITQAVYDNYVNTMLADPSSGLVLTIKGLVKPAKNVTATSISGDIGYTRALSELVIEKLNSAISANNQLPDSLAVDTAKPIAINIFCNDFDAKQAVVDLIAEYNSQVAEEDQISYTDLVGILMGSVSTIVNAITYVLIAFVSISLIVSSIMIGIITYISVLERIKEIGILRSIGASKRDIKRVFTAESLIIGFTAGALGIIITLLLCIPINIIINSLAGLAGIASLPVAGAFILVALSMLLTFIAGLIPARIASKKDPVVALRTE